MKKLWYLLPTLIFALGIVACGEDDTEVDPTPSPGPTEETTPPAVKDLVVKAGLNEATLSWTLPSDQTNIKKIKIGTKVSGENNIDWTVVDQVCSSYTVTDLDEPAYYFEVRTVNEKKESVGATSDLVDIYTLDGISEPKFELYEDETGWVLKATNLSTSTSVFHSVEWSISDTRATVCEGSYVVSEEEKANIAQNKSTITEMEWLTEHEFDDEVDYAIYYKVTVFPALGGALNTADNTYYYEGGILDQSIELEESTSEVVTQLTPDPLVIHFWGGDSPNVMYEQIAFAWDAPFGAEKYLIYYGADYETATVVEVVKGSDQLVDAHGVTASDPVGEYAKVWSADKAYIIKDMTTSPAYVRVEAVDVYDRVIAMGQYYTYNFTVRADQEDIQDHQPKFSIEYQTKGEHQYQWAVTAKHMSAARAYAKIFSWKAKSGDEVVAEGTVTPDAFSIGYKTEPQLRSHSWYFDDTKFDPETKYTIEYEITYVPTTNSYEVGDKTPLDYNPETKEFTPAANPDSPTGIAHDPRVLRPLALDGDGHIKYRTRVGDDDKVYTYYDEECRYITLSHCNYDHSRKEILIKSSDIAAANSDISFDVVSSEKPENLALDLNVKAEIDEGTERKSTESGHRGLRSINGIYQSAHVTWNHPLSAGIETIVINGGGEDIVLTADNWAVAEGKGAYTLTGLTTSPATITVKALKGGEELASDTVQSDVYTISDVDVEFEIIKNDDGSWSINAYGIAGENYSFYSLSFNLYKNGSAVFNKNITKNGDDSIKGTIDAWITNRGASSYIEVNNGDWDGEEFDKITFDKLEYATEYEVRYELVAFPVIYDPVADAEDYHKHPEWFYYSRLNTTPQNLGEMITSVATAGAPDDAEMSQIAITGVAIKEFQKANCRWEDVAGASYYITYTGSYDEGAKLGNLKTESQVEAAAAAAEKSLTKSAKITAPAKFSDQAPYTYESAHWPAYIMVVAYDAEDKPIAAGQANNYVYTVSADNPVIQYHQPTFSVKFLNEKWYVTASHISSALAYAKSIKWDLKDAEGNVIVSKDENFDAVAANDKSPALKELSWGLDASELDGKTTYTIDYEIVYVPVGNKWKHESDDNDFRTLRKCEKVDGHFQHQLVSGDYAAYSADCDYMYNAAPLADQSITITSADIKAAGADIEAKTTITTSEKTEQLVLNLASAIDEGVEAIGGKGHKSINGKYQAVDLSWDQPDSGVSKVEVKYGTDTETVTAADLTVTSGRAVYSVTIPEELCNQPTCDFTVVLYDGDKEVGSETITAPFYTMDTFYNSGVTFRTEYQSAQKNWKIFVDGGLTGEQWFFYSLSFNFYKKSDLTTPVFTDNITKNGDGTLDATIQAWAGYGRGSYAKIDNSDYDDACTKEYSKANATFTGLEHATDYVVKYELKAYPQIYDAAESAKNPGLYFFSSILMDDAVRDANVLSGEFELRTEDAPADPEVLGLSFTGDVPEWQMIKGHWQNVDGVANYVAYYGHYDEGVTFGDLKTVKSVKEAVGKAESASTFAKVELGSNPALEAPSIYWPGYVMVVGYDASGEPMAAGQINLYNYTVRVDDYNIWHHQPKFSIAWDESHGQWKVTADHISAALGYATKLKWNISGVSGATGEVSTDAPAESNKTPKLKSYSWYVAGDMLDSNTSYTFDYEITYAPTSNRYADVSDDNDYRTLRLCDKDGQYFKFTTTNGRGTDGSRSESCNYTYDHAPLTNKLVTITSSQLSSAGASLDNKATTDTRKEYTLALAADVDEGTDWVDRVDATRIGLKSINGMYQAARLSWVDNSDIASVTVAYDGQSKTFAKSDFTVKDGRASVVVNELTKPYYDITVTTTVGGKELSETIAAEIYTLEGVETPRFKVFYDDRDGYKKNNVRVDGWAGKQNFFYSFKFQFYKDGQPVFSQWIEKKFATETQFLIPWASYAGISWLGDDNYDDWNQYVTGLELGVEYDVEYEMTAWPTIHDPELTAEKNNGGFYFKKILMETHTVTGTAKTYNE